MNTIAQTESKEVAASTVSAPPAPAVAVKSVKTVTCSTCSEAKPYTAFSRTQLARRLSTKSRSGGNVGHCKACTHARDIMRNYKMTMAQFNERLAAQHGKCALAHCGKPLNVTTAHIDHDHSTGKVRGLLCIGCNTSLGGLGDSVDKLLGAVVYLSRNTSTLTPAAQSSVTRDLFALEKWLANFPSASP